jgi:catechol-2,3-dioxygenase
MEIKELGHIVLYVKNLERSVHFYRDVLGFRPIVRASGPDTPRFPAAAFSSGRTHHELLLIEVGENAPHPGTGHRSGLYHFGLKVGDTDDELRGALATLIEEGVRIVGSADHHVTHSLYILDPDDNELELYIDVPGVDWRNPDSFFAPTRPLAL